jgi:hypothetical protein
MALITDLPDPAGCNFGVRREWRYVACWALRYAISINIVLAVVDRDDGFMLISPKRTPATTNANHPGYLPLAHTHSCIVSHFGFERTYTLLVSN